MIPDPTTALPTRSQIEGPEWDGKDLLDAQERWLAEADAADAAFQRHRQNMVSPGGTDWEGQGNDAAVDRVDADIPVTRWQSEVRRESAGIAGRGYDDIRNARNKVFDAIAEAEAEEFAVGEDYSVKDTKLRDWTTAAARAVTATEHAEFVRWQVEQLVATDGLIHSQIEAKAVELAGIRFEGETDGAPENPASDRDGRIVLVDNETGVDDSRPVQDQVVERGAEPRNELPETGSWPPPGTPIEGGTPGGDYFPGGLGDPVEGTELPETPEPPAWVPSDVGAGPFGSWEPRNPGDALAKKAAQGGAWWTEDDYPQAARNMQHYFGTSGAILEQDVGQMLNDLPDFQQKVNGDMQNLGVEAISRAQSSGATGPLTFPVNTEWFGHGIASDQRDWYLALGNFDYNLAGQVTVYPPSQPGGQWSYALDADLNMRDRYNWDIGKATPIMGTPITDAQMARFHLIGYAQEFTMTGRTGVHSSG